MDSILGVPTSFLGPAAWAALAIFFMASLARGIIYFKWQVDKMFKDKDELIEALTKRVEDNTDVKKIVVQILERLNEKAKAESDGPGY